MAGFDEVSLKLRAAWPRAELDVVDVVDHRTVTSLVHVFTLTSQLLSDTPAERGRT